MKRIFYIFVVVLLAAGCSYESTPPKTTDGTSNFVLPKGEIPTDAEVQTMSDARTEYEQWLENNS